jgi:hypothetical protein
MDKVYKETRLLTVTLSNDDVDDAVLDFVNKKAPETRDMDITDWDTNNKKITFNLNTYKDLGRENPNGNYDPNCAVCNPVDRLGDYENDELKNEIEDRGYYVYDDPKDALNDVDVDDRVEDLKLDGYYIYDAPAEALADCDNDELIEELHQRDIQFDILETIDGEYLAQYLQNHKGYKVKKICGTSRCNCC